MPKWDKKKKDRFLTSVILWIFLALIVSCYPLITIYRESITSSQNPQFFEVFKETIKNGEVILVCIPLLASNISDSIKSLISYDENSKAGKILILCSSFISIYLFSDEYVLIQRGDFTPDYVVTESLIGLLTTAMLFLSLLVFTVGQNET